MAVESVRMLGQLWPVLISVAMYFLGINLYSFGQDSLLYSKLCYQKFDDDVLCNNRTFTKTHPDLQVEANTWGIYITIVQIIPATIFTVIFSSYCDLIAHKLPILISIAGLFALAGWVSICSYFPRWPMYTLLFGNLMYGLSGSYALILMSMFSYIALKCNEKYKAFFLSVGESMIGLGMLGGSFASGPIADSPHLGLSVIFLAATGLSLIAGLVILFAMKDLYKLGHETKTMKEVFSFTRMKESTLSMFRKRCGYQRAIAHTSFAVFFLCFTCTVGSSAVSYLYFTKEIGMSQTYFTVMQGILMCFTALVPPLLIPVLTKFKVYPLTSIIAMIALHALGYIILSSSKTYVGIWVGQAFQVGSGIIRALTRNIQATIFHNKDLGKVFAYEGFLQIVLTYISMAVTKAIYSESVALGWPNAIYAVLGFTEVLAMISVIVLHYFLTKHKPYEALCVDNDCAESNGNLSIHVEVSE